MPSDPLVVIVLLLFMLLIAVLLTIWLALTSVTRQRREPASATKAADRPALPGRALSNDQVRGAKATRPAAESKRDKEDLEDAFERFLRAKNDDLRF
jgi:hypothetical protein